MLLLAATTPVPAQPPGDDLPPPNVLWLSSEDNGPHLGAYGDTFATTPNLDRLAARGLIYRNAWSTAPVCAPARTTIISGLYPVSTGAQHMRSQSRLPEGFRFFPELLREAGYYTTNNSKQDYNLAASPEYVAERERLAGALRRQLLTNRDLGFLPEGEMHRRAAAMGAVPWAYGQGGADCDLYAAVLRIEEYGTPEFYFGDSYWGDYGADDEGDSDRRILSKLIERWPVGGEYRREQDRGAMLRLLAAADAADLPVLRYCADGCGRHSSTIASSARTWSSRSPTSAMPASRSIGSTHGSTPWYRNSTA